MEKYYLLSCKDGREPLASAFAPKGSKADHELIEELNGVNELPFDLSLIKLDVGKNGLIKSDDLTGIKEKWLDYQPNNLAWPLMSQRLKLVIETNLTGNEQVDWITCKIMGDNEERLYFIPRFNNMLDVLDLNKTVFVKGTDHIIKPVFAATKVSMYSIFSMPSSYNLWKITSGIYVCETLKKVIKKQNLTGLDFEKTSVV